MRYLYLFIFSALLLGTMNACISNIDTSGSDAYAIYQSNLADIQNYAVSKGLSGSSTSSGLYYVLNKPSSSTVSPAFGQEAEYTYTLYSLSRSTSSSATVTDVFVDSTYASKSNYLNLVQGSLGLTEGLFYMHEGDQSTLLIAYSNVVLDLTTQFYPYTLPAPYVNSAVRYNVTLKRVRSEDEQINNYIAANNLTVTQTTADGARFILTKANPTGAVPKAGQTLTINYSGKLLRAANGFSGGTGTGSKVVGVTSYIAGFEEGISLLKVGEKATVIFPSSLGYGASGAGGGIIPAYAPLSFDLELVSAQ